MTDTITIDKLLHKVRLYRENEIFKSSSSGHISLSERAKLDRELEKQAREIDMAVSLFRYPDCNICVKQKNCFKQKYPDIKCFEIEL